MTKTAFAKTFTPVLNTVAFQTVFGGADGTTLALDNQGLLRAVETIAFPGSEFKITASLNNHIVEIETKEYPSDIPLYVDERFLIFNKETAPARIKQLAKIPVIINELKKLLGTTYIWGGNCSWGIPELLEYYPPKKKLEDSFLLKTWILKGVDCSGLLYQVTNGYIPRNTSDLVHYGEPLLIENLSLEKISNLLQPLDLIVWKGHMIIVLDHFSVIESRGGKGVISTSLSTCLEELIKNHKKKPVNRWDISLTSSDRFVIRRWHPEVFA